MMMGSRVLEDWDRVLYEDYIRRAAGKDVLLLKNRRMGYQFGVADFPEMYIPVEPILEVS